MAPQRHSSRTKHNVTLYQAPVNIPEKRKKTKGIKKIVALKAKTGKGRLSKTKSVKLPRSKKQSAGKPPTAEKIARDKAKADRLAARLLRGKLPDNDKLVPRKDIKVLEKNPQFETNATHPFVSVVDQARMGVRAANLNDAALLKKLAADTKRVPADFISRSSMVVDARTAVQLAIEKHDFKLYDQLLDTETSMQKSTKSRVVEEQSLLDKVTTGRRNFAMLGRHTRKVQMTRGAKEGNNALIKTSPTMNSYESAKLMLENGVSPKFIDQAIAKKRVQPHLLVQK